MFLNLWPPLFVLLSLMLWCGVSVSTLVLLVMRFAGSRLHLLFLMLTVLTALSMIGF